jgi:hypothetical protein
MVYNADLVLELPPALFAKLFPHAHQEKPGSRAKPTTSTLEGLEDELLTELFHTFPFAKLPKREWDHENEMHVRGEFNDLYPACLGVLTSKV